MDNPDLSHQWLPFTANRAFAADPRLLVSAEGVYYRDAGGRQLLDSVSGLFCVPAGHGRPEIASAVSEQIRRLDFAPPFQFAHPDGFVLAGELSELLPPGLDRVFFVNSGSEAVETALKGALAYHRARGDAGRTRFIGRERAYHGVNFGGLSVSGMVRNREAFGPGLPGVSHIRATWSPDQAFGWGQPRSGGDLADDLQRAVDLYGASNIAAVIVEPISGSTGVLVPPEGYLERLAEIAAASGILLIFDEVITGFGRTGRVFRLPVVRSDPRHHHHGQGAHQRGRPHGCGGLPARGPRRRHRSRCAARDRVLPRLHVVRPPVGLRRRPGRATDLPGRGPLRAGRQISPDLPAGSARP